MKTLQKLHMLLAYYCNRRGTGHTTILLEGARNAPQVMVLAHTMVYASDLAKRCDNAKPLSWTSMDDRDFAGRNAPLAIDNSAMIELLKDAIQEINALRRQIVES